jgi:predicted DNA-binding transcriptional regulator YafY
MPTNLHALIRYRIIDQCLRRKGKLWTWQSLAEACGEALREFIDSDLPDPSRRTVFQDIETMKSGKLGYEAPILFDRKKGSYKYTDPAFSISNTPLTSDDITELHHALVILKQFSGFKHMEGVENIITKLEHTLNLKGGKSKDIIRFDHPIDAPGQKWLDSIYRLAHSEQTIHLHYQPFIFDAPMLTVVSPYLLKEYNNRWFLIGYDHTDQRIYNFALDRIVSLHPAGEIFFLAPDFHADSYFKDIIGVSIPDDRQIHEVVLEVSAEQAKYVLTKPLHPSQKVIRETPGHTVFSFALMLNYELESLILSFGERARVLAPESLKIKILERLHVAIDKNDRH